MPRQVHNNAPVRASSPSRRLSAPTTSSAWVPTWTTSGVLHDSSPFIGSVHFFSPLVGSRATISLASTSALTMTRSWKTMGDAPLPQVLVLLPTLVCQSWLPARSKAKTPAAPKETNNRVPSEAGVAEAYPCSEV